MNKKWTKRSFAVGAVAAGAVLLSGGAAEAVAADTNPLTTNNNGVASGNQVVAPVQVPIDVCGNAAAVGGVTGAGCDGSSSAEHGDTVGPDILTTGNNGIGNGNQIVAPVQVPIDVCGNAVGAVVGAAGAGCDGGATANQENGNLTSDMDTVGNQGIGNGNQVQAPIQVPVDACGNSVSALVGVSGAGCDGGAVAQPVDDVVESTVNSASDDMPTGSNPLDTVTGTLAGVGTPVS